MGVSLSKKKSRGRIYAEKQDAVSKELKALFFLSHGGVPT